MRTNFFSLIIVANFILFSCKGKANVAIENAIQPNILLINIDDLGWRDLQFMGSTFYETPNIDALSKQGVIFTNGYAAASNCAPSRACLMTGLWPQRHGIYTVGTSERGESKDRKLIPVKNTVSIDKQFLLLPQTLHQNGYMTCHAGKWHLSDNPLLNGFDVNIGGSHEGHPKSYYPPYKNVALKAEKGKRLTDLITDKTIDFIQHSKNPFFINFAPYAVHTPIQPVPNLVDKYKNKKVTSNQNNAEYATMVENTDHNVGRLIEALKHSGKLKNTFIIFTSDNGGVTGHSSQHPLRAGKGSYYEGGIRVPFLIVWKGKIKAGQQKETPITNFDIYPTLLDIVGIEKPKNLLLDGKSFAAEIFKNGDLNKRPLFWHFPIYLEANKNNNQGTRDPKFRTRPGSVVRYGDWKLHYFYEDDGLELYNLKDDIGEKNNLVVSKPEKAQQLYAMLEEWLEETEAPIPTNLNVEYVKGTDMD